MPDPIMPNDPPPPTKPVRSNCIRPRRPSSCERPIRASSGCVSSPSERCWYFFFVAIPLLTMAGAVPDYKLNILGKYLCFGIVALGIDLVWGYTGLLSLCQALFFALGGYAMAMHLSLPQGGGQYRLSAVHDIRLLRPWQGIAVVLGSVPTSLVRGLRRNCRARPGCRRCSASSSFAAACAASISPSSPKRSPRRRGCSSRRNEMLLGGTNGLTNFYRPMSQERRWIVGLYLLTLTILVLAYLFCRLIVKSRLGRVLVAVRDKETRLYFAGYKPYAFKVFAFSVGAMLAGIGGMLYSPQVPIITPQDMNVEASIFMVVMVAIGGRGKLWGAVFGAILLNVARSSLSSDFSSGWLLVEGLIAVSVVLYFPDGFAGIWETIERQITGGRSAMTILLTATPLAAISLFVLGEALGIMPDRLNLPLQFGPKGWLLLSIMAAGAIAWAERRRGVNWWIVGTILGIDVAGIFLSLIHSMPQPALDLMSFELQWKYLLLVLVLASPAVINWFASQNPPVIARARGFDVIVPAVAAAGKES